MLFDGGLPFLFGVAAVNAEDFHLAFILFVVFLHVGYSLDAPAAPASPEVQHDIFAAQRAEGERLALQVVQREVGCFGSFLDFGFSLFEGFFFLHHCVHVLVESAQDAALGFVAQESQGFFHVRAGLGSQVDGNIFVRMLADVVHV